MATRTGISDRGRGTGTAVLGRRRTPDGEGQQAEDFLRLRPPQGRKRTADRLTFVRPLGTKFHSDLCGFDKRKFFVIFIVIVGKWYTGESYDHFVS